MADDTETCHATQLAVVYHKTRYWDAGRPVEEEEYLQIYSGMFSRSSGTIMSKMCAT
jgi:hypothetical protein